MGTPNKYKKEFCSKAEEILATGKSLAAVCASLDIARCTLYEWRDKHPEFKESLDKGLQKCQQYWEEIGEDGIKGNYEKFGAAPWIFTMKNRFREDYKEEKEEKKDDDKSVLEKLITGEIKINHDS
jgi:transposase-like protein